MSIEAVIALLGLLLTLALALAGWAHAIYRILGSIREDLQRVCGEISVARTERKEMRKMMAWMRAEVDKIKRSGSASSELSHAD